MENEDVFAPPTWPKSCTCCEKKFSLHAWMTDLKLIGIQKGFVDGLPDLELRNCDHCGSTLALVLLLEPEVKDAVEA